jgi:hypothetical protein
MLLQIQDTFIPISSIVALKKSDGRYSLTFWSPRDSGDAYLRTVILSGESLTEVENWLGGQIVVKVKDLGDATVNITKGAATVVERRKGDRRKGSSANRREART